MNAVGIILIIMLIIFTIALVVAIIKISELLGTIKSIKNMYLSTRGIGKIVDGKLKDIKMTGVDMVLSPIRNRKKEIERKKQ